MSATLLDQPSRPMTEADIAAAGDTRYQKLAFLEAAPASNIAINGGMEVSQENGTTQITLATTVAKYVTDLWQGLYVHAAATAVFKCQQVAPPGTPAFGAGFPSCLQMTATTLSAMAGAGDLAMIAQPIEGYRIAKLGFGSATNPQSVTVGFWVYATVTGTATVSARNSVPNRSYLANFTVNAANTWEYKTVTIPADATGTWLTTNGAGLTVGFCFGAGSTYQGTNNAWQAGNFIGTSSTTNFYASNSNTVCITGVGVWAGTDAPTAARSPFSQRPLSEELLLCKRYFYNGIPNGCGILNTTTSLARFASRHPVPMRATPTNTITAAITVFDGAGTATFSALATSYNTADLLSFDSGTLSGALTQFRAGVLLTTSGGNINVDARL